MSCPLASTMNLQSVKSYGVKVYTTVVVLAVAMGAIKGAYKWAQWYANRPYRNIKFKTLEPVVNVSCDVGQLAFDVIVAGTGSGLVGATAPVSVPLIRYYFDDQTADKPDNKSGNIVQ